MLCGTWSSTTTVGALVLVLWKFSVGVKMFLNVLDNFFCTFWKKFVFILTRSIFRYTLYRPKNHAVQTSDFFFLF